MKRRSFLKAALSLLALPGAAVAALRSKGPTKPQKCLSCGTELVGWTAWDGSYSWSCPNGHIASFGTAEQWGDFWETIPKADGRIGHYYHGFGWWDGEKIVTRSGRD